MTPQFSNFEPRFAQNRLLSSSTSAPQSVQTRGTSFDGRGRDWPQAPQYRSLGRILYKRGVDVNAIRVLYNHSSTEMTLYDIEETLDGTRAAVEKFDLPRSPVEPPVLGA